MHIIPLKSAAGYLQLLEIIICQLSSYMVGDFGILDHYFFVLAMIDSRTETGRSCEMQMNVEKTKVMRISRQPSKMQVGIDKKQPENVEYLNYLGSMVNDARYTREIRQSHP